MTKSKPLLNAELRALYEENPTPELRTALFEIHRLHSQLVKIDEARKTIQQGWDQLGGGGFVALHALKILLSDEPGLSDYRAPVNYGRPVASEENWMFPDVPDE